MNKKTILIGILIFSLALNGAGLVYYKQTKHYVRYLSMEMAEDYFSIYRRMQDSIRMLDEILERGQISIYQYERLNRNSEYLLATIQDYISWAGHFKRKEMRELNTLTLVKDNSAIGRSAISEISWRIVRESGRENLLMLTLAESDNVHYDLLEREQHNLLVIRTIYGLWSGAFIRQFGPIADDQYLYVNGELHNETRFYKKGVAGKAWVELLFKLNDSTREFVRSKERIELKDLFVLNERL